MNYLRTDPGPCIVRGAPHCGCTGEGDPMVVDAMPVTARATPSRGHAGHAATGAGHDGYVSTHEVGQHSDHAVTE